MKGYSYPLICPLSKRMCIRERCPKDEECSHKRKRLSDKEFKESNEENDGSNCGIDEKCQLLREDEYVD
jgi:hypothetical protein